MSTFRDALLRTILSQPTAPFRERHVISAILHELKLAGVPHFQDPVGNIVIGVADATEYRGKARTSSREPLRVFIAHMDHPGFHGLRWKTPTQLEVHWHGGSPTAFLEGAPVWLADRQGWAGEGHLTGVVMTETGRAIARATVEVPLQDRRETVAPAPAPESLFGGFRFRETSWQVGRIVYTKAADDLVGAFGVVSLALDLFGGKKPSAKTRTLPFIGLLTRAEEVGFIGAIAHLELGWLKGARRPLLAVSLETSRTLPGAEIGKGPVVRLGDRFTVFDPGSLRVFTELAARALPGAHQRRVMDGGTCEATAATVFGIPAVGISIPLGNYHNQSFEGGPDSAGPLGPAPEFVHLDDVAGLIRLGHALLEPKLPWRKPFDDKAKELRNELKRYRGHLKHV